MYNIFSIKHLTSKFHVVVVLNNGKEMYKKVCCTYKWMQRIAFLAFFRCRRCLALNDFILFLSKL